MNAPARPSAAPPPDAPHPSSRSSRPRSLRPALALAAALGLAGSSAPGVLAHPRGTAWEAAGNVVSVRVLVGNKATPLYQAAGRADRRYFEASRGRNYALAVRNESGDRVGVLITVDGLNVVSGERSSLGNQESMYVLGPWEEAEIQGWRTSLDEVRRFVFVDEERSYAERTGQGNGDLGWIRVLAFREVGVPRPCVGDDFGSRDARESSRADESGPPSAGAAAPPREQKADADANAGSLSKNRVERQAEAVPGTGWGDRRRDVVTRTLFRAEPTPTDHVVLRYEYAAGLLALGIDCHRPSNRLRERDAGEYGFARPPRG
jgi:hypothetical protein